MMKQLLIGAAATMAAVTSPCAADPAKGYRIRYVAARDHYCITPVAASEAYRFGISLYRTECHSIEDWAAIGIKLSIG